MVVLGSGAEERNARWANSRRSYNAGYGVKSLNDLHAVIAFFEERRGRLHGFRWRDPADWKSCPPEDARPPRSTSRSASATAPPPPSSSSRPTAPPSTPGPRDINKPVAGTVLVAVAGACRRPPPPTPSITPPASSPSSPATSPPPAPPITAGFEFDVPVRFDTDKLEINIQGFRHGAIPSIPIVEIRV